MYVCTYMYKQAISSISSNQHPLEAGLTSPKGELYIYWSITSHVNIISPNFQSFPSAPACLCTYMYILACFQLTTGTEKALKFVYRIDFFFTSMEWCLMRATVLWGDIWQYIRCFCWLCTLSSALSCILHHVLMRSVRFGWCLNRVHCVVLFHNVETLLFIQWPFTSS